MRNIQLSITLIFCFLFIFNHTFAKRQGGLKPANVVNSFTSSIEQWTAFNPGAGYFFITNIGNKKVLDVAGSGTKVGTNVGIWGKHEGDNQKFKFVSKGNGYYAIETALKKDIYLSVHNSGKTDNTNIKLNNPVGQQQHFKVEKNTKEEVRFISKLGNDLYLGTDDKGSNLALRKGEKGDQTLFSLSPTDGKNAAPPTNPTPSAGWTAYNPGASYFFIANIGNEKIFDVAGSSTEVGTNVGIWGKHEGDNQKFKFVSKGNGYYAIETALKKDSYLSIHNSGKTDNTNIKLNSPIGPQQHFKIEKNAKGEVRFISKLGNDLYLGTDDKGSNIALRKGEKGNKTLFNLTATNASLPTPTSPSNNTTEPVVTPPSNNSGPLTIFSAYDKDGMAVLEYKYEKKEDENNFSTECSLPEWLPEYDFTTTSEKYLDIFYPACAKHDRNYRAPWRIAGFKGYTGREIADESWYEDMITICDDRYKDDFAERQYCKVVAKSWLTGVHKSPQGKEAFDSGQKYADKYYDENSIKTGGIIYVNSDGSYLAYMKVNYILNGKRINKERTLEPFTSDEIALPLGASDINLHVYGKGQAEDLNFKKNYANPVKECFEISGKYDWGSYDASWKTTSCN